MQEVGHVKVTVQGDAKRLRLEHGDIVLLTFRERLPITAMSDVKQQLESYFPRNKVLIVAGVESFAVIPEGSDIAKGLA